MTIPRIPVLAVALLLLLAVACSSEGDDEPAPTDSPQVASVQPTPAPTSTPAPPAAAAEPAAPEDQDFDLITLLPFDAIPAVLDPVFISAEEAESKLANRAGNPDDALVLGLSINGDTRAYYVPSLSAVEIVNDTVGGQPLAVTW